MPLAPHRFGVTNGHALAAKGGSTKLFIRVTAKDLQLTNTHLQTLAFAIRSGVDTFGWSILQRLVLAEDEQHLRVCAGVPYDASRPVVDALSRDPRWLDATRLAIDKFGGFDGVSDMVKSVVDNATLEPAVFEAASSKAGAKLLLDLGLLWAVMDSDDQYRTDLQEACRGTKVQTVDHTAIVHECLRYAVDRELRAEQRPLFCNQKRPSRRPVQSVWTERRCTEAIQFLTENTTNHPGFNAALFLLQFVHGHIAPNLFALPRKQHEQTLARAVVKLKQFIASSRLNRQVAPSAAAAAPVIDETPLVQGTDESAREFKKRGAAHDRVIKTEKAARKKAGAAHRKAVRQQVDAQWWCVDWDIIVPILVDVTTEYDCDHVFELQLAGDVVDITCINMLAIECFEPCFTSLKEFYYYLSSKKNLQLLLGSAQNQPKCRVVAQQRIHLAELRRRLQATAVAAATATAAVGLQVDCGGGGGGIAAPSVAPATAPGQHLRTGGDDDGDTIICSFADALKTSTTYISTKTGVDHLNELRKDPTAVDEMAAAIARAGNELLLWLKAKVLSEGEMVCRRTFAHLATALEAVLFCTGIPVSMAIPTVKATLTTLGVADGDVEDEDEDEDEQEDFYEDGGDCSDDEQEQEMQRADDDDDQDEQELRRSNLAVRRMQRGARKLHASAAEVLATVTASDAARRARDIASGARKEPVNVPIAMRFSLVARRVNQFQRRGSGGGGGSSAGGSGIVDGDNQ